MVDSIIAEERTTDNSLEVGSQDKSGPQPEQVTVSKSKSKSKAKQGSKSPQRMSSQRKPEYQKLGRRNAKKRNAWFIPLTDDDMGWLWAAYIEGSFDFMAEGANQEEFTKGMTWVIEDKIKSPDDLFYLAEAYNVDKKRTVPVGLIVINFMQGAAWPLINWFSWATPRNKIEASVVFLEELQRESPIMIMGDDKTTKFLSHLGRYGLLSRSKVLKDFHDGERRYLHYGKKVDR